MTRESYAFRRFRVQADEEPDAETITATMQCAVCGQTGPTVEATKERTPEAQGKAALEAQKVAASWVETHQKDEREHFTFRLMVGLPYRLVPGEWQ
ncbi:hypothetical protein [Streptomyces aidingensis]|uniref:DUF7848 domain-containing protein n=1 Tax=Streptomyces aidingensis TaxID=910347 RepID=A0A1I1K4C0_9ACTN|nr:hypothetical protein [Streptomyces aidingensis]SFC55576.1 hypothetical protein SAMN05421773_10478 [Streptomyces aidingensis]